jgi:hypothetical protein
MGSPDNGRQSTRRALVGFGRDVAQVRERDSRTTECCRRRTSGSQSVDQQVEVAVRELGVELGSETSRQRSGQADEHQSDVAERHLAIQAVRRVRGVDDLLERPCSSFASRRQRSTTAKDTRSTLWPDDTDRSDSLSS